jgi:hypothetical protein
LPFIGVLRDRLGELEDRFFATVFLGSGLLFLAMLFASAAVAGGIIMAYTARPEGLLDSATCLRPRRNLRDHEPLRGQDGIHDLYLHTYYSAPVSPRAGSRSSALPARSFCCSADALY